MSDFWQAPGSGLIINLDHIVAVDRVNEQPAPPLRVVTVVPGVTLTIKAGSPDEASLLKAIGERLGSGGQLIEMLGDIRDKLYDIREAIDRIEVKPCRD